MIGNAAASAPIRPVTSFGVSFSIKQCRSFDIPAEEVLDALLHDLGVRRFRLMSYWDEHEKRRGQFDFSALDRQIDLIAQAGGEISLCLGVRQPRWPENHWPEWAWRLPPAERTAAILKYVETILNRYKSHTNIISWQLENEALLRSFGERPDIDRGRLRAEFALVKRLDPSRPCIMTTSNSWGLPLRRPIPDIFGFSYYVMVNDGGLDVRTRQFPWFFRLRAWLIRLVHRTPVFIHELQAEPWGPRAIWEMSIEEQDKSVGLEQLKENIALAQATQLYPIDLWGAEWWYWRKTVHQDASLWDEVRQLFHI